MNKPIVIEGNKILKMKNLIKYTIDLSTLKENDKIELLVSKFENHIKNNNLTPNGPLVMKTNLIGGDEPKMYLSFLRPIKESFQTTMSYDRVDELDTGLCVYSKFIGKEESSSIANSKMQVYAYENNLILDTLSYIIRLSPIDDNVVIDTFIPIIGEEL